MSPATTGQPTPVTAWWPAVLGTALAYALLGGLAVLLAQPPAQAAPVYLPAGLALAAVLVFGPRALLGVALGSAGVNLLVASGRPAAEAAWLLPLATGAGAALQAGVGAWLVRRWVGADLALQSPRQVALFLALGAGVACLVSASLAVGTMHAMGMLGEGLAAASWWTWWSGDALGVVIGTPVVLALLGRPSVAWAARRRTVALPLVITSGLLFLGAGLMAQFDAQRARTVFERDASMASAALSSRLQHAQDALQAMRGVFVASAEVTASEFRAASTVWLAEPTDIQALGYSPRVARADTRAFEQRVLETDGQPLRVFDRDAPAGTAALPPSPDQVVVRMVEPLAPNQGARGVNALSIPAARAAIERARASGQGAVAATAPFALTQVPDEPGGVVLYAALFDEPAGGQPPKLAGDDRFSGVVFSTLRTARLVAGARAGHPDYLHWCLYDATVAAQPVAMAGKPGCHLPAAAPKTALVHTFAYDVGGRAWQLRLQAEPGTVLGAGTGNARLFSATSLLVATLLCALLLTVTGHTSRVEQAVQARTAELHLEVAERERTASALLASEQRLRNIFDHAPVGIAFCEVDGRVREANPRICEMLGLAHAQLAGRDLVRTALPAEHDAVQRALAPLLAGAQSEVQHLAHLQHAPGDLRWMQTRWSLLRDTQGRPLWLVAVFEDITERHKRAEAEQGRQVAESANLAKNEFLSRMSHELRTPLNAMLGFTQLLEMDRRPTLAPHQAAWTAQVLQAGWHLLEMINDTLDLSRIEAGDLQLRTETVPLGPVVEQSLAIVAGAAQARRISVQVALAPACSAVQADPTRLKQVLINLLSNAVKYNTDGGQVRITSHLGADGQVCVQVQDTGIGLSATQLGQLFQPFNRLGRERSAVEGTGIGLVISRRLAECMGGQLQASSAAGQGATFTLSLPAASATAPADASRPAPAGPPRLQVERHVHCIEDNQTNIEVVRGILAQRPQLRVSVSHTGLEGLSALRQRPPDLLLLDMNLPDIDGVTLLKQLRQSPQLSHLPVLVVSADATAARVEAALAAGARHYLTKPLNVAGLLSLVDEVLEELNTTSEPAARPVLASAGSGTGGLPLP